MINDIYTNALLSAAAYADWGLIGTENEFEIKEELINERGFTEAQYKAFFVGDGNTEALYQVIPNGYTEDLNGFSATVFKHRDTGKLTVSFRGTDGPVVDWLTTNLNVVFGGLLVSTLQLFLSRQDDSISTFLEQAGLLTSGTLNSAIDFAGHSLGGFLATIATYKYHTTINQAYTYNGLGVSLVDYLSQDILNGISLNGKINNYYSDIVGNYVGIHPGVKTELFIEEGSALANHSISKQLESLSVYRVLALLDPKLDNEADLNTIGNILKTASNQPLQSLETTIDKLGNLLGGNLALQANKDDIELFYQETEAYIANQGGTLNIVDVTTLANSSDLNNAEGFAYRYALVNLNPFAITGSDSLYTQHNMEGELNIENFTDQYLQDRARFLGLKNEAFSQDDVIRLAEVVEEGEQTFYRDLSSDVLKNIIQDAGPHQGIVLPQYVTFGTDNDESGPLINGSVKNDRLYGGGGDDTIKGSLGDDYIEGNSGIDVLEGGSGKDRLLGGTEDDTLYGGEGDDHLEGGTGFDTYIYNTMDEDGNDTIIDSDGLGQINWNGDILAAVTLNAGGSYIDNDKGIGYQFEPDVVGGELGRLILRDLAKPTESSITINSYTLGQLSLTQAASGEAAPDPVTSDTTIGSAASDIVIPPSNTQGDNNTLEGLAGDDFIRSFSGDDILRGGIGNDWLYGEDGNDWLYGGADNDQLFTGTGHDYAFGGDGDDFLDGNSIIEPVYAHVDESQPLPFLFTLSWEHVRSTAFAVNLGLATDSANELTFQIGYRYPTEAFDVAGFQYTPGTGIYGLGSVEFDLNSTHYDVSLGFNIVPIIDTQSKQLFGEAGDDTLVGNAGNDWLSGGTGHDSLQGNDGNDSLFGGDNDDILLGGQGNDALEGGKDNDYLYGEQGNDRLYGDKGNDFLWGDSDYLDTSLHGDDTLDGGAGNDQLVGGGGVDTLMGGADNDVLFGEGDDDKLYGDAGVDYLNGGTGNDILEGGTGNDQLWGEAGSDTFVFNQGDGIDTIFDADGSDIVQFKAGITIDNITSEQSLSSGGQRFLTVSYGQADTILIKNGYENSIASYQFSDGTSVDTNEFLAATLSGPIDTIFNATQVTAYGSQFDDTVIANDLDNNLKDQGVSQLRIKGSASLICKLLTTKSIDRF
ncbi:MAG: hypothetical protein COB23_10175 [Methylophaga sp.]|nr:MAG: hypothetical protein COB23_10175 [Methylophaga sp.]